MRLIDADELCDSIWKRAAHYIDRDGYVMVRRVEIALMIDEAPTIDAVPVVHGRWKKILRNNDGTSDYECSACLGLILDVPDDDEHELVKYCPNCGAKMDGDK